jgi:hypothetical protein
LANSALNSTSMISGSMTVKNTATGKRTKTVNW